jgi:hypothetical protein
MMTQVQDGTDSVAGCLLCEPAGLGMNQDVAGFADHLSLAQKNARVREVLIVRTNAVSSLAMFVAVDPGAS